MVNRVRGDLVDQCRLVPARDHICEFYTIHSISEIEADNQATTLHSVPRQSPFPTSESSWTKWITTSSAQVPSRTRTRAHWRRLGTTPYTAIGRGEPQTAEFDPSNPYEWTLVHY
jgi:hypothetical protein